MTSNRSLLDQAFDRGHNRWPDVPLTRAGEFRIELGIEAIGDPPLEGIYQNDSRSEARSRLANHHGFNTADLKSLYRHLEGRVHITVSRILRSNAADP